MNIPKIAISLITATPIAMVMTGGGPPPEKPGRAITADTVAPHIPPADPKLFFDYFRLPEQWAAKVAEARNDPVQFDQIIREYLSNRMGVPKIPVYGIRSHSQTIEDYKAGVLRLGQNKPVPFTMPPDWHEHRYGLNFEYELHSLRYLTNFMDEFESTKNREYLDVIDHVLADWLKNNVQGQSTTAEFAWLEGSVSKRLLILTPMLDRYAKAKPPGAVPVTALLESLHEHARYLCDSKNYIPNGNHGMRQDLALLTLAATYPEFKDADKWRTTALQRLHDQQVNTGFTKEGVWKEHSPRYHYYVIRMLRQIESVANAAGWSSDAEFLKDLRAKSNDYLAHVLTPDGDFPPIGDSTEDDINPANLGDDDDDAALMYTVTKGAKGTPSTTLDGFYPDAGEAIFRDSWGSPDRPADQAFYVHIHAAYHAGFGHRHQDDLSFVVHDRGRMWIVEAGKYSYDQNDFRDFVKSAQAHNSVTYNGKALAPGTKCGDDGGVRMSNSRLSTKAMAAVRATTRRFPDDDAKAERTYVFLRDRQTLILLDHFTAEKSGTWQSCLHFAPDAECQSDRAGVSVTVPTHPTLRLDVAVSADAMTSIRVAKGEKDPMLGWYSPEYRSIVPTPVMVIERKGSDVLAAMVIRIDDAERPRLRSVRCGRVGDNLLVQWNEGEAEVAVRCSAGEPLSVTLE